MECSVMKFKGFKKWDEITLDFISKLKLGSETPNAIDLKELYEVVYTKEFEVSENEVEAAKDDIVVGLDLLLHRFNMSVGDVVKVNNDYYIRRPIGWKKF